MSDCNFCEILTWVSPTKFRGWVWVLISSLFLVSCGSSQVDTPVVTRVISPPVVTQSPQPTFEASPTILLPTTTIPATYLPTPVPPTPRATLTPQPTATPRNQLTERIPTLFQVNSYLNETIPDFYGLDYSLTLTPEDVNQDGRLEYVYRHPDGEILTGMYFEDVNGDSEDDLVVTSFADVIVMFWMNDHYANPYWRSSFGFSRCNDPLMRINFEDWTGDGISEVVGQYITSSGGSALCVYETNKIIVYCDLTECNEVWSGVVDKRIEDGNTGGLLQQHVQTNPVLDDENQPGIRAVEEGFSISCCDVLIGGSRPSGILTSTLTLYSWNGIIFEETDKQIVSLPHPFDIQSTLSASNSKGILAQITAESNNDPGLLNEYCDLYIGGDHSGPRFGCQRAFTIVSWKDINGDDQEEVVVITYSAGYPIDRDGNSLDEITCMHQHLLAFQYDGQTATEIANITGCVIRNDLFGVRLEDLDGDGNPEIIAAPNGELGHRAYKWNGTQFVFWSELPEP